MILRKFIKSKPHTLEEIVRSVPGSDYLPHARWSDFTSLGAGLGTFPLLRPLTVVQAASLAAMIRKHLPDFRIVPLGGGTDLVGADRDIPDMVYIKLAPGADFSFIERARNGFFLAGAALSLKNVLDFACTCSSGGAAGLYGIPGTIGGAGRMNAGANGKCFSDFLEYLEVLDLSSAQLKRYRKNNVQWAYRSSTLPENILILRAAFRFDEVDPNTERDLLKRELLRRMRAPAGRSAGSIFKNPSPDLPAGRILEKCGAKKLDSGRFQVSPDHANWIINRTDRKDLPPSEKSFLAVADAMAGLVYDQTGILIKPEVRFVDMVSAQNFGRDRKALKVLVLKGGVSSEREISLLSAANVVKSLREGGFDVSEYDIRDLVVTDAMREADVVYPVLHGGYGEDGRLKKMLEDAGIRSVGAGSEAMRIIMDKVASKRVMDANGITNAKYAVISSASAPIPDGMSLPLVVKPNSEGSTFGLTLVETPDQWKKALETALQFDRTVLVEEYISGVEATVGILNGEALPLIEIRYPGKIYDYDAKYTHAHGETLYLCPPQGISARAQAEARDLALRFAKAAGAASLLRVDVIIRSSDDRVFVLEGNSMPGCTASSLLPKAAVAAGIGLVELHAGLVMGALKKN